mmetsp:Transcript_90008/g.288673  ORF Transcript_90008/g.288673 Transcript_90008/m.288673 type:complete len:208 (+) Transcript_90008:57-680(+)
MAIKNDNKQHHDEANHAGCQDAPPILAFSSCLGGSDELLLGAVCAELRPGEGGLDVVEPLALHAHQTLHVQKGLSQLVRGSREQCELFVVHLHGLQRRRRRPRVPSGGAFAAEPLGGRRRRIGCEGRRHRVGVALGGPEVPPDLGLHLELEGLLGLEELMHQALVPGALAGERLPSEIRLGCPRRCVVDLAGQLLQPPVRQRRSHAC